MALQPLAEALMNEQQIPGAVLGIWHVGQLELLTLGITNIEHPLPVTAATHFQIGSISKSYVATAIMRLVERGQLGLDDRVRAHLPHFALQDEAVADQVTVRHLLTHSSGWLGDYFNDFGWGDGALAHMVAQIGTLPQITPLGTHYSYNNAAFAIAGRLIEGVAGEPFERAMARLIFEPLALTQSAYFPHALITRSVAAGHRVEEGDVTVTRPWAMGRAAHPAGGIVQTMGDLLTYAQSHMDGNESLLSEASKAAMRRAQQRIDSQQQMGLSWFLTEIDGVPILSHGGATNGQIALLQIVPSQQFAVGALTNSDNGSAFTSQMVAEATAQRLGLRATAPQRLPLPPNASDYVSRYEAPADRVELRIEGDALLIKETPKGGFPTPNAPPPPTPDAVRAMFCGEDEIVIIEGISKDKRATFIRNEAGQIAYLRIWGRLHEREENGV